MSEYLQKIKQLDKGARMQTEMPRYQCHKKVWALKIGSIEIIRPTTADLEAILGAPDGEDPTLALNMVGAIITPSDHGFGTFGVTKSYIDKHDPQPGGYFVQYEDGYMSYSPPKAFEEGYTRI